MSNFDKIETFLKQVDNERKYTGEVRESFLDGDLEIRLNIGETDDDHRGGSFSILMKADRDLEQLAKEGVVHVRDVEERFGDIEDEFVDMIDEYCGYNAYEPIFDEADRPEESEFDLVAHDSVIVFD